LIEGDESPRASGSATEPAARGGPTSRPPPLPAEPASFPTPTPPPVHSSVLPPVPSTAPKFSSLPPLHPPPFRSAPPAVSVSTSVAPQPPRARPWLTMREIALVAAVASVVFVVVSMLGRRTEIAGAAGNLARDNAAEATPTELARATVTAAGAPSPSSMPSAPSAVEIVPTPHVLAPSVVTAPKVVKVRAPAPVATKPASVVSEAASAQTSKTASATAIPSADEFGGRQ
jgi:hypothetical protein